jgi:hypothetical protein
MAKRCGVARACKHCGKVYPYRWRSKVCLECRKARTTQEKRRHYLKDPAKARDASLQARYGMTIEEYKERSALQLGRCALCLKATGKSLHVDHSHDTGQVRGLLCSKCNLALGLFHDSPVLLCAAVAYLEKPRGFNEEMFIRENERRLNKAIA